MPREAKLQKYKGYWITKAGSPTGHYFGKVGVMSYADAREAFGKYLAKLRDARKHKGPGITVAEMADRFIDWLKEHRSGRTLEERSRHLRWFTQFRPGKDIIGDYPASSITVADLKGFLSHVADHAYTDLGNGKVTWLKRDKPLDGFTVGKVCTSVIAAFSWAAGKRNPSPCLPRDFHPFAGFERYKRPPEPLLESELPTPAEVRAILDHADDDLEVVIDHGKYRERRPDEFREKHKYQGFRAMLTIYFQSGARTSELADARVAHFVPSARQIVLGKHKRSKTQKETTARRITLSDEGFRIVGELVKGKGPNDPIFTDPDGRAWTRRSLAVRFQQVRKRAGVRNEITIYSFRHLWISEALMAGVDVGTVAKMAGTSIAMIEKVYGHYSAEHFVDAQRQLEEARRARLAV